ncbi:hypothetical protein Tco_0111500 [Tanacetum coccineum]
MYVRPVNFILPKSIPQKIEVVEFGTRKVDILFLECLSTDNSSPSTPGSLQANSNASNLSLNLISPLRYMDSIMEEIDLFLVIAGFNTTGDIMEQDYGSMCRDISTWRKGLGLEKDAVTALGTKMVKAKSQKGRATITG